MNSGDGTKGKNETVSFLGRLWSRGYGVGDMLVGQVRQINHIAVQVKGGLDTETVADHLRMHRRKIDG